MHGSHLGRRHKADPSAVSVGTATIDQRHRRSQRTLAEETPIALVYNGTTLAVVMATPADLLDLARGFSLTEGIVGNLAEIDDFEEVRHCDGIELRMWLRPEPGRKLMARRRQLIGPTGCGLCGIESLKEATRPLPRLKRAAGFRADHIATAIEAMADAQDLNHATRATHAAGYYTANGGLLMLREDVGRHNAVDKLAGALAARSIPSDSGALVLTSRVSIELVQKAAAIGINVLIAVSAPTALAVRTAAACRITLVGIARGQDFEIFSHADAIRAG